MGGGVEAAEGEKMREGGRHTRQVDEEGETEGDKRETRQGRGGRGRDRQQKERGRTIKT